ARDALDVVSIVVQPAVAPHEMKDVLYAGDDVDLRFGEHVVQAVEVDEARGVSASPHVARVPDRLRFHERERSGFLEAQALDFVARAGAPEGGTRGAAEASLDVVLTEDHGVGGHKPLAAAVCSTSGVDGQSSTSSGTPSWSLSLAMLTRGGPANRCRSIVAASSFFEYTAAKRTVPRNGGFGDAAAAPTSSG